MNKLIEVKIDSLRVSLTNQQRIVVLKEMENDRYLPIWIGPYEAESITIALQEIEVSRPQTHDLIKNLFGELDVQLIRVVISELKDDIFYGTLVLNDNGEEILVDSRPSDAIAIAVRSHVPIMVAAAVMDEASIVPEEITPESEIEGSESEKSGTPLSEDRLSIFEDYLKKKTDDGEEDEDEESGEDKPKPPSNN